MNFTPNPEYMYCTCDINVAFTEANVELIISMREFELMYSYSMVELRPSLEYDRQTVADASGRFTVSVVFTIRDWQCTSGPRT